MYNGRHISFKRVLYRAMNHPNATDLSEEQAAEYAFQLIRTMKMPLSFGEKTRYAVINDHRVEIPEDLIYIRGMRFKLDSHIDEQIESQLEADETFYNDLSTYLSQVTNWLPIKYTGDIYQSSFHCEDYISDPSYNIDITYTINNNYIFLSEPKGAIEISYRNLIVDDEGYPMIPDDQDFENALYYYILKEHFFPLVGVGKITQYFYEKIEQEYAWAVGKAQNSLVLAGFDHWDATMNGIRRLIQYNNFSDYGYSELHRREQIKKWF